MRRWDGFFEDMTKNIILIYLCMLLPEPNRFIIKTIPKNHNERV